MTWVPDGGQIVVIVATGGLTYVARLLFKTGRLLGRLENRLADHDRRLNRLEGGPTASIPEYLDRL